MMLADFLRYLAALFTQSQARKLGFLDSSIAIANRRKKLTAYWQPHLEQTKQIQDTWSSRITESDGKLLVLGAGRLFDVNLAALTQKFSQICFVDADPLSTSTWHHAAKEYPQVRFNWEIKELSGAIAFWQRVIAALPERIAWYELLQSVRKLHTRIKPLTLLSVQCPQPDAIISLNLLSQIPIMWQDLLEKELKKRFSAEHVLQHEEQWLAAFGETAQVLIRQHLEGLKLSRAKQLLIVTDLEYVNYSCGDEYESGEMLEVPIIFKQVSAEQVEWQRNPNLAKNISLSCEVTPALYGVELQNVQVQQQFLAGYRLVGFDNWLWHIQPQGHENKSKGLAHRVAAFEFEKI